MRQAMTVAVLVMACTCTAVLPGCRAMVREDRPHADSWEAREAYNAARAAETATSMAELVRHVKAEHDAFASGQSTQPPVVDILIVSGGGDWGAFGAGVLMGWGEVEGELARPQFDVVTGVSTGALIAPFAFVGTDTSIALIDQLYRNPKKDFAVARGPLFFLPHHPSFVTIPGLVREIERVITPQTLARVVEAGESGRLLAVNTTNVDMGEPHAWNIVAEARQAVASGDDDRVRHILLASAAIPGVFPPVEIDDGLYVDGAVTGNILYGGRQRERDSFLGHWLATWPDVPVPRMRYWVILNNQLLFPPEVIQPTWPRIIARSSFISNQSATVNALRHLHAMATVMRETQDVEVEVRIIAVPNDWRPPAPGTFNAQVMNELADLGASMGRDPSRWMTTSP